MSTSKISVRRSSLILIAATAMFVGAILTGGVMIALNVSEPAHAGEVFRPPDSIDHSGVVDVSDSLSKWIATSVPDGTADAPSVIDLDGDFRVEYGLAIGNGGPSDRAFPGLVAFVRNHVVFDLTHATLIQKDPTPFSNVGGVVVEPRKRYGVPILRLFRGTDIRIHGGNLVSTNTLGHYSAAREPWHGVTIVGTHGVELLGVHIQGVWGDFVYINHSSAGRASDVLIDGGVYERNGRQGITLNAVDNLEVRHVEFLNVQRMLFDHEPDSAGGATNVRIHDNVGNSGGLGYMSLQPLPKTPLTNVTVTSNHLFSGHFRVMASAGGTTRTGFTFTNNITDTTTDYAGGYLGRVALITVGGTFGGWNTVTIQHNHDHGLAKATAISVSPLSTKVVTTPNDFVGFRTL